MNCRAIHYIKLRRKGLTPGNAARVSGVLLPDRIVLVTFLAIGLFFNSLFSREIEADARLKDADALLKYHQARIQADQAMASTKVLEAVIIRCLRGDVVTINKHTHQCKFERL
jgi:predicted RNA-binding protein